MPELRSGASTSNLDAFDPPGPSGMGPPMPPPFHVTPNSSASDREPSVATDDEQRDASPRRRPPPRRLAAPDLEDALTRLTQTVQQMVTLHQPAAAAPGHPLNPPEDPNFNWTALRSPLETPFPLPPTGTIQRIVAGLFAKLQANGLTGRDLHEARFAVDMMVNWEDMDEEY